jgi:hypothetical protein
MKPFKQGMTLAPGESASLAFELPEHLSSYLDGKIRQGALVVMDQGPTVQDGNTFRRLVTIMVNGEPFAKVTLSWEQGKGTK